MADPTTKPNSAEFADQREIAMLKSRKHGNPNTRLIPEINSARVAKTLTETESEPPSAIDQPGAPEAEPTGEGVDYEATSDAIIEALHKCKGKLTLSIEKRREAAKIIDAPLEGIPPLIVYLIMLIVGIAIGFVGCRQSKMKQSV